MKDFFSFEFITNNFFKQFIEILNVVINQEESSKNITLRLSKNAIYIIKMIKFEKCQYYLKMVFSKNSFKEYIVDNELEIIFNGQTFIKTCKNIQKNNEDRVKIIYENDELKIVITNESKKKIETIILNNNNISCYKPQDKLLPMDIDFKDKFFKFNTIDFSNLKKSINLKNETINISLFENEYIVFESRSQGTSPLHILYGDYSVKNDTKITINTKILNLLAKLNLLVNGVQIYQSMDNNKIKIFGEFLYPKNNNTGEVEIIIFSH